MDLSTQALHKNSLILKLVVDKEDVSVMLSK